MSLLLPQESQKQARVWLGDGLPSIPQKLHDRMLQWEFIDFAELKPTGTLDKLSQETESHQYIILPSVEVARAKRKPVEDIHTWLQCFGVYVAAMSKQFPEAVPDLMAYMITIMRAQREYEEPAWRLYDTAFRDKAASTGNRKWAQLDPHIYNQIFTGRARKLLSTSVGGNDTGRKRYSMEKPIGEVKKRAKQICWDWNAERCTFEPCKFRHCCSQCGGRHPKTKCSEGHSQRDAAAPSPKGETVMKTGNRA